jgi:hypothetical protein
MRLTLAVAVLCCTTLSAATAPADTTLALACQGTTTALGSEDPQRVSMGIIVNFTKRTVQGFGHPDLIDYPVQITAWNDVTVAFRGTHPFGNQQLSISGSIDRVTGDVEATDMSMDTTTHKTVSSLVYTLKCRPTQRMF